MVRRRSCAVSNHEVAAHPSRRGEDAAPQDEDVFVTAHYPVARWMLTSLTPTSRAVFTIAAQVSSGKGTPFLVRSARIFRSGSPGISTASPVTGLVARIKST